MAAQNEFWWEFFQGIYTSVLMQVVKTGCISIPKIDWRDHFIQKA